MRNVLVPVDGSDAAFQAVLYLIDFIGQHGSVEVHVVNVQPKPVEWQTHGMEKEAIDAHLATDAHLVLKPVLHALNEAEIDCRQHVKLGDVAETVVALANELGCDTIVMGTRGLGAIPGLLLGSVTRKVLHLARIPVICVPAQSA